MRTWTPGFVEGDCVLCVFGPSLFGYSIIITKIKGLNVNNWTN